MLKFLQNRDEVMDLVHNMSKEPALRSFKIGVSGSYITGLNKKGSSIDIVLKLRDGENEELVGDMDIMFAIQSYMVDAYSNKVNVIWLDLLETDEENLLKYMASEGVEKNPESAYTNIVADLDWVDDDDEDEDSEDSDDSKSRISSVVMTYDEDEDEDSDDEKEEE